MLYLFFKVVSLLLVVVLGKLWFDTSSGKDQAHGWLSV
jgi:hypothetical protein